MNDKSAHNKLKDINKQRNTIGIGGYKDSRRMRCEGHDKFNTAISEINKLNDDEKMKGVNNE